MFEKEIVIDGSGHILGRLASTVAKEILAGQKVVVVRCEAIEMTGSMIRNKMKWARFMRLRHNTNPVRGPFHYRSPARIFWRTVRGMIPHKTYRGKQALARMQSFEGVPEPFDKKKRMVVPNALKVLHVKTNRKTTVLGEMAAQSGWKHADLIKKLEAQRIAKSQEYYVEKKANAVKKAKAEAACGDINATLESFGYYVAPTEVGAMAALKAEMGAIDNGVEDVVVDEEEAAAEPAAAPAAKAGGSDY